MTMIVLSHYVKQDKAMGYREHLPDPWMKELADAGEVSCSPWLERVWM